MWELWGGALPAMAPSLRASTSECCSGSWEAPPGCWEEMLQKQWRSEEQGDVYMCVFVCVFCWEVGPKQICLLVINSPDWHNSCQSYGKARAYVQICLPVVYAACMLSQRTCEYFSAALCVQETERSSWRWGHFHVIASGAGFPAERPSSSLSSID